MRDLLDAAAAGVLLIATAPLFVALATWVRLAEGGPVLFVQKRVGRDGALFEMYKFRTMVDDAIAVGQTMQLTEDPFGIVENDPRITRSGRFMRRTSLDELPQLWNVIRGDMRLVGPRPDVPDQVAHYTAAGMRRLVVKPGITGWVQVNGRDELPWPERFELDAWYVEHQSLTLDLRILARTVTQIGRPEPAATPDEFHIGHRRSTNG